MYFSKEKVDSMNFYSIGIQDHEWILIKIAIATLVIGIPLAILNGASNNENPTQIFRSTFLNILYYFLAALGIFATTATATYFAYLCIVLILSQ